MTIVFDVGATSTRIGTSADGQSFDEKLKVPTPPGKKGFSELLKHGQKLAAGNRITAAAAGLPGIINQVDGSVYAFANLPDWNEVNARQLLGKLTKGPVCLDNDTALVGLGEAHAGSGTTEGIMAYVTVSSGVNGVRIVDGRIDRKTKGFELGRQLLIDRADGWQTLEHLIGGKALQERMGRLPSKVDDPEVWRTEIHYLAAGLYNLMLHWSPSLIVLGGSMMRDIPMDRLKDAFESLPKVFDEWPELRPATLGEWGGLQGGLALLATQPE